MKKKNVCSALTLCLQQQIESLHLNLKVLDQNALTNTVSHCTTSAFRVMLLYLLVHCNDAADFIEVTKMFCRLLHRNEPSLGQLTYFRVFADLQLMIDE